jgi:hypothetical protein
MPEPDSYINNYVERTGFERYKLSEKKLDDLKNVKIFLTYGDLDSVIVFSNIVYPKIKESGAYNIFISWKNLKCFVQDADEFWCLSDENTIKNLYNKTDGLENGADGIYGLLRSLKETFLNVDTPKEVSKWYKHYLSEDFKKQFNSCEFKYPDLIPPYYLNQDLVGKIQGMKKLKIVWTPFLFNYYWQNNLKLPVKKYELVVHKMAKILSSLYDLILIQNEFTFDLSKYFKKDEVTIVKEHDFGKILTLISMGDVYLDFFSNSYLLGFLAKKSMYIVFDKQALFQFKKYEDIQIFGRSKNYSTMPSFFTFPSFEEDMIESFVKTIANGVQTTYNCKTEEFPDVKVSVNLNELFSQSLEIKFKKKVFFRKGKQ